MPAGPLFAALCRSQKIQHRADIVHHRRDRHLGAHRAHAGLLGRALFQHVGAVDRVAPGTVIEVGEEHVVSDSREPARHHAQLLADAGRIHHQEHRWIRAATLGMDDERLHRAVVGGDVEGLFDHVAISRAKSVPSLPCPSRCFKRPKPNRSDAYRQGCSIPDDERWILHYGDCGAARPWARDWE